MDNNEATGFYDVKKELVMIPNSSLFEYFYLSSLRKLIPVNDEIKLLQEGKILKEIKLKSSSYPNKDFKSAFNDFELVDGKVLVLKNNDKAVIIFDIESKRYLALKKEISDEVIIAYYESESWRTDYEQGGKEELSIIDLKNKKYLKNVFTHKYTFMPKTDEKLKRPGEGRECILISHKEKAYDSFISIKDNLIFFYDYRYDRIGIFLLYDTKHGKLVEKVKGQEQNSLYVAESEDSSELHVYNPVTGKFLTLLPIKIKYVYEETEESTTLWDNHKRYNCETYICNLTIFKSIETGKYYIFKGSYNKTCGEYIPSYELTLEELDFTNKGFADFVIIPSFGKLFRDDTPLYALIKNDGTFLETMFSRKDINDVNVSLLSTEKINQIYQLISEELKKT